MAKLTEHNLPEPTLQSQSQGKMTANQQITVKNCTTGATAKYLTAEPANPDPKAPVNLLGKFRERRNAEEEMVKQHPERCKLFP
jgi:hypothetical protein